MAPRFRLDLARRPNLALLLAVIAGIAVSLILRWLPQEGRALTLTPVVAGVLGDAGSPASGAAQPQVTIVVFTDYQCPVCKATEPALHRLLAADPTVRVVWKDWPIRGPLSHLAARTALAAHRQGRYEVVHTALMDARGPLTGPRIAAIARSAGADPTLAGDPAVAAQLQRHASQAFGLGLSGTPAYLVGPYLLEGGLDDRRLRHAVDRARRAGPPQPR
jgi:protein-disulfide isomerase